MTGKKILSYSKWEPVITPEEIFADVIQLGNIKILDDKIFWTELRPAEKGRNALVCQDVSGRIIEVVPSEFNVRTRVYEYGGLAFTVTDQFIFFTNFEDQRLYRKNLRDDSPPIALTPEKNADSSLGKYGAPVLSADGKHIIFVYEKECADKENENFIATIDATTDEAHEPRILVQGHDFYFDPRISSDGTKIAWIQYNHPNMPWNSTELIIADFLDGTIIPGSQKMVAGGNGISICAIQFDKDGRLYFIMDEVDNPEDNPKNWYNIYRYDNGKIDQVTQELTEFAGPAWVIGLCNYAFLPDGKLVANYSKKGRDYLALIDPQTREIKTLSSPFIHHFDIKVQSDQTIIFVGVSSQAPTAIIKMNIKSMETEVLRKSFSTELQEEDISVPELIEYPTSDGQKAYAQLYLPKNSKYDVPEGEKPPLIVEVHGGPTARTSAALSLRTQFWTTQGYTIIDIDHRGSTSYGRQYRDALKGQWGRIDTQDIKDGVDYLLKQGFVTRKVAIRGGSAGGYAVQRAMTMFPDTFQVGASYFGIGNLITLIKLTHKFESRYMDWLVDAKLPEDEAKFKERSPYFHLDKLKAPMILLQGSEDKVVTPEVSREMVEILKQRGIRHEYVEYEGEGHGFRQKENNIDALHREAAFFRNVLYG